VSLPDCGLRMANPKYAGTCNMLSLGFALCDDVKEPCAAPTGCEEALAAELCPLGWVSIEGWEA